MALPQDEVDGFRLFNRNGGKLHKVLPLHDSG
jgi:hypothetical protein